MDLYPKPPHGPTHGGLGMGLALGYNPNPNNSKRSPRHKNKTGSMSGTNIKRWSAQQSSNARNPQLYTHYDIPIGTPLEWVLSRVFTHTAFPLVGYPWITEPEMRDRLPLFWGIFHLGGEWVQSAGANRRSSTADRYRYSSLVTAGRPPCTRHAQRQAGPTADAHARHGPTPVGRRQPWLQQRGSCARARGDEVD